MYSSKLYIYDWIRIVFNINLQLENFTFFFAILISLQNSQIICYKQFGKMKQRKSLQKKPSKKKKVKKRKIRDYDRENKLSPLGSRASHTHEARSAELCF